MIRYAANGVLNMTVRQLFILISILLSLSIVLLALLWTNAFWLFMVILPLIGLGIHDMVQTEHTILRLYPVIGRIRFLF